MANEINFTFSDLISGYVTGFDQAADAFSVKTTDGREFRISLTDNTYAEIVRNLGEGWQDAGNWRNMLSPGRYVYAYGIYFPEGGENKFEAKHIVFPGRGAGEWRFETPDWWVEQIEQIGDFYLNAQWPDGNIDFRNYRTHITVEGAVIKDRIRQETDTISRAIYGWASAYLLTGEDRFLEAAEKGTDYLREHMRAVDPAEGVTYWYHAIDIQGEHERKILASQFGDDIDAIPAYEQIYALAGPTQTYRITGDPRIRQDIDQTLTLFEKYFYDPDKGGYFSHIDPINFDPRAESLGPDRARKNWNSVGDHAPAYLINLWLATGEDAHADFLAYTGDTIAKYFPNYDESPFVQEKFFEDWSPDRSWGWQQNRAVVGHNLKIAWNLMRINSLRENPEYVELARKIAELMPKVGMDAQRGGWYDVVDRVLSPGQKYHRYAWHDRKAWWQQEQGILAYMILNGCLKEPEYQKLARESASFYNAWFLDSDNGGVYFNVLANGIPYLLGTERLKGSHSMSLYHSTELCYLSAVYTNLLTTRQPLDLHFKPKPGAWKDNILRVAPDILPPGSIRLDAVWIDGESYTEFDAEKLEVKLPDSDKDLRVRVRVGPTQRSDNFYSDVDMRGDVARVTMTGKLTASAVVAFKSQLDQAVAQNPRALVLLMNDLDEISSQGVRCIVFASEHLKVDCQVYGIGANDAVKAGFEQLDFAENMIWSGDYDEAAVEKR